MVFVNVTEAVFVVVLALILVFVLWDGSSECCSSFRSGNFGGVGVVTKAVLMADLVVVAVCWWWWC